MEPVAHLYTNLSGKFGLPRQAGIVPEFKGRIVFTEQYRNPDALRGLESFSHIWILWLFSESPTEDVPVMVRPPRLGGNAKKGVFASRSPFRPNGIGMSVVKMDSIDFDTPEGPVSTVSGPDLMSGTPILDIKPYMPYSDSIPEASAGYTKGLSDLFLTVAFPDELLQKFPPENREELVALLHLDPRPQYQRDPERVYGLTYLDYDVRFRIDDNDVLTVCEVVPRTH